MLHYPMYWNSKTDRPENDKFPRSELEPKLDEDILFTYPLGFPTRQPFKQRDTNLVGHDNLIIGRMHKLRYEDEDGRRKEGRPTTIYRKTQVLSH